MNLYYNKNIQCISIIKRGSKMKIAILGYSGSGKSTLARELASYYHNPVLHLDTVQFTPGWVERDKDEARFLTKEFMKNESWVIDGNYRSFYQQERLEQADKIIFLNFPRRICFFRAYKRYLNNKDKTREDMAEGCEEKFDLEFAWWILHKGRTKEVVNRYKQIEEEFKDKVVVLKNPKEVSKFLENLTHS